MVQKFFLGACLLAPIASASADSSFDKSSPFTGFFLEGGIGGSRGELKTISCYDRQDGQPPINVQENKKKYSFSGVSGQIALGYGHVFSQIFYLGGQIYGEISSLKKTVSVYPNDVLNGDVKKTPSFGVRFRPGVVLFQNSQNPTLCHVIVGWGSSQWKVSNIKSRVNGGKSFYSKSKEGITLGMGFLTKVSPHLSAGLEFTHTSFKKKLTVAQYQPPAPLGNPTWAIAGDLKKPTVNTLMLKMAYTFNL